MTKAIILAAGQGTRLRPFTDFIPKTMVPLKGRPIIEYQMDCFQNNGISEVHVVAGYREDKLQVKRIQKKLNPAYDRTNMVASLYVLKDLFDGTSDIIISYGDIIFDNAVLAKMLKEHGDQISIIYDLNWLKLWSYRMEDPLSDAESFKLDSAGNVKEIGKEAINEADVEGQYIGLIHVNQNFTAQFFSLYESLAGSGQLFDGKDFDNMYMTSYLQMQIDRGTSISGVPIEGGWVEVDSVQDKEIYENMIEHGKMSEICKTLA
ncbi:MAG: nucleotidyl transferase [Opitutae bacterium]|nr:nucleotidyl transferase [Opitutae bacterium]|tara:strand:- start:12988 stop:13776 length:789 start_codon:yes stop_codon:yes gene_type:complete